MLDHYYIVLCDFVFFNFLFLTLIMSTLKILILLPNIIIFDLTTALLECNHYFLLF